MLKADEREIDVVQDVLVEHGLLEKVDDSKGYYEITDKGRAYLAGELDAADLE